MVVVLIGVRIPSSPISTMHLIFVKYSFLERFELKCCPAIIIVLVRVWERSSMFRSLMIETNQSGSSFIHHKRETIIWSLNKLKMDKYLFVLPNR